MRNRRLVYFPCPSIGLWVSVAGIGHCFNFANPSHNPSVVCLGELAVQGVSMRTCYTVSAFMYSCTRMDAMAYVQPMKPPERHANGPFLGDLVYFNFYSLFHTSEKYSARVVGPSKCHIFQSISGVMLLLLPWLKILALRWVSIGNGGTEGATSMTFHSRITGLLIRRVSGDDPVCGAGWTMQ